MGTQRGKVRRRALALGSSPVPLGEDTVTSIVIRVPIFLLREIDRVSIQLGLSRSNYVRLAAESLLRVSPATLQRLQILAQQEGIMLSKLIEEAVNRYTATARPGSETGGETPKT